MKHKRLIGAFSAVALAILPAASGLAAVALLAEGRPDTAHASERVAKALEQGDASALLAVVAESVEKRPDAAKLEGALEATVASASGSAFEGTGLASIVASGVMTLELKQSLSEFKGPISELVRTKADVNAYANLVAEMNPAVERISLAASNLEVVFDDGGRFLWVIPVRVASTMRVGMEGEVAIDRPWYSALIDQHSKEGFVANVQQGLGSNAEVAVRAFAANAQPVDQVQLMRIVVAGIELSLAGGGDAS